ncbi:hypothetical protein GOBAR_DD01089 [Gossypium barbadense]|nr:hypothetical protein GOBAR_DD01089 [Gossypium barbadense]
MGSRREATNVVTSTLTGLIDDNFNENEEEMSGSDVSGSDASESDVSNRIKVNLDGLNMDAIKVDELCDSDDSGRLDSAHEYDSDGQNWPEFNLENDMSNLKLKVEMLFKSKDSLKEVAKQLNPNDPIDQTWQIRSSNPNHTCSKVYKNRNEKNPTHWSRSHFSIKNHSDLLVNNLFESFNKIVLEAKGKFILNMIKTIRTKIMLLIVKNKEEADKWKGMLCPKIKKKLDVNIKDSLRNWDLTSIPCMHALAVIHLKDEFPKTYVQTWYTKQTQLQIYSNFIRPVKGPKQWASLSNMLPILPPTLRKPPGRPTKVIRKEPDEPQKIERLSKRGVDMRSKDIKLVSQLSNKLPQISKRVPQLNRLPQLSYKLPQLINKLP